MRRNDRFVNPRKALFALVLLSSLADLPAQTNVAFSPEPTWVRLADWQSSSQRPGNGKAEGTRYLLYERQEDPLRSEQFERIVLLMDNETGVQDSGNLSFHFDPSYQQLILHRVQIHRDGQVLERLEPSKLKVIQPERALGLDVFTGDHTALLFVEDLRVGDALEYAYSTRGVNPITGDHYSTRFVTQSSMPVERQRMRVVWPAARPLHIRQHLVEAAPAVVTSDGITEYTWDFTNLTTVAYEDYLPAAFELYPYIELSDFADWSRVVEWALPLYTVTETNLPADLESLIRSWKGVTNTVAESALLALQFVQDDLRYTGLELGPDSYRPAQPLETFQKRFGDCKGKALLYCTLLRAMGVDAWPALVNSSSREAIARRLPSPFAFNHVIVKLSLREKAIWVDPTISHQGGRLEDRYMPPVGKALVIRAGVRDLEDVPASLTYHSRQRVVSTFRMKDYDSPVPFSVKTIYRGRGADNMREQLAREDFEELAKDYLNYYARHYADIQSRGPLKFTDDRANNVLTVVEEYEVKNLWRLDESSHQWEAEFYAESLFDALTDPATRLRKLPLALTHPFRREQEIIIHLPDDDWSIPESAERVEHEGFSFRYRRKLSGSILTLHYECETKVRELTAEQVPGYLEKLEAMENLLGDVLRRPDHSAKGILAQLNWLMVAIAGFALAAAMLGSIWVWRKDLGQNELLTPPLPSEVQLQGLGGWLILVGIGICLAPFLRIGSLVMHWEGYFSLTVWQEVAMPQSEQYHPLYAPLLMLEVLGNTLLLGLNGLVIGLFFARRRLFPKAYIALLASNAVFILLDDLAGNQIPFVAEQTKATGARDVVRAWFSALIWCSYILKSRRVKLTFIR